MTPEICTTCGGALGPGSELPPCLCELAAPSEAPPASVVAQAGGGTHARALKCPSCGGWLDTGMRRCSYCDVQLASVRCWRCFELSFSGTQVCAGCGAGLGLEGDLGPTDSACPSCREPLHLVDVGDHRVHECQGCGGLLVDHTTLRRLTELREAEAGVAMPGATVRQSLDGGPVKYRKCPVCQDVMTPRAFARRSGILVDVCKHHGVWFDADELTHVLTFVATGGMKEARAADLADAKLELSRRRSEAMAEQMRANERHVYQTNNFHSAGALVSVIVDLGKTLLGR